MISPSPNRPTNLGYLAPGEAIPIGTRLGELVIASEPFTKSYHGVNRRHYRCACDCGGRIEVPSNVLRSGRIKRCHKFQALAVGTRFGMLTIIGPPAQKVRGSQGRRSKMYPCLCDCGESCEVNANSLIYGGTKSCGCLKKLCDKRPKHFGPLNVKTHRGSGTRLHSIWKDMRRRCYDQSRKGYHYYGARGITVCDEWRFDFAAFREWAMGAGYRDDLSIERVDVNKAVEGMEVKGDKSRVAEMVFGAIVEDYKKSLNETMASEGVDQGTAAKILGAKGQIEANDKQIAELRKADETTKLPARLVSASEHIRSLATAGSVPGGDHREEIRNREKTNDLLEKAIVELKAIKDKPGGPATAG